MGEIILSGVTVDTEDIDLLVRFKPLAELDALVKADREILEALDKNDPVRPYWVHRSNTHWLARDIAEWCFDNDFDTIGIPKEQANRTQGLYALQKYRELEKRVERIEGLTKKRDGSYLYD
ncbi:MAG: hypothetical protein KAS32_14375 [Candidatus Peribacteraceae bacterium]|nr:hypothetical protein [Candidatus Peribacteraceae bacterium]